MLSSDIQECTEVTSGRLELGSYELHDLVQIGSSVGIIVKIERDSFRILDTGGHVQIVMLQEMGNKRNNKNATSFDGHRNPVVQSDMVAIVDGMHKGRSGVIKHVYRYNAFVYCKEILENGGIIVVKCAHLNLLGGRNKNGPVNTPFAGARPQVTSFFTTRYFILLFHFLFLSFRLLVILMLLSDSTPVTSSSIQRYELATRCRRWWSWRRRWRWRWSSTPCTIRPLLSTNHYHHQRFMERLSRHRQGNY